MAGNYFADGAAWLARRPLIFTCLFGVLLLWPAFLHGSPFLFGDSEGYVRGGKVALSVAHDRLFGSPEAAVEDPGVIKPSAVMGVRSVAYSLFAYLTSFPGASMWLTIAAQALMTAGMLVIVFSQFSLDKTPRAMAGMALLAAFATPAAWYAAFVTPDIFAGLAVLAIALLTAFEARLALWQKLAFGAVIAYAVCAHLSHVPVLGFTIAAVGLLILLRKQTRIARAVSYAWVAGPGLIGLFGAVAVNAVGFGEVSVTGKHYPIVLASAIEAGPARWYLERECGAADYAVCEIYGQNFPATSGEFLWGPRGVRNVATPEQMDRIRAEESDIVAAASAAYPYSVATQAAWRVVRQIFKVGIRDHQLASHQRLVWTESGEVTMRPIEVGLFDYTTRSSPVPNAIGLFYLVIALGTFAFLAWAGLRARSRLSQEAKTLLVVLVAAYLINAAVCSTLSAVADRYQARIAWTLIMCAAMIGWTQARDRLTEDLQSLAVAARTWRARMGSNAEQGRG